MHRRAFTLIELLIASAIASIILLSLYGAFNAGLLSYQKLDAAFDTYQSARVILSRLESDLKNIFPYRETDTGFKGNVNEIEFFKVGDIYMADQFWANIFRIKYEFSNQTLKRTAYAGQEAFKLLKGDSEELSAKIKDLSFQYCAKTGTAPESYEWQEVSPPKDEVSNSFPFAVKIKLSLIQADGSSLEFDKIIPIMVEAQDRLKK
jgi:prepilin-type N-terminal cleavage/methylation domain-containing protein